jgi:hypothetical protein
VECLIGESLPSSTKFKEKLEKITKYLLVDFTTLLLPTSHQLDELAIHSQINFSRLMRCLGHVQIYLRGHSYFSQNSLKSLSLYQSKYSFRVVDFLDQAHPFQNQGLSTVEDQRNFC